jgi:hypothetical protein
VRNRKRIIKQRVKKESGLDNKVVEKEINVLVNYEMDN